MSSHDDELDAGVERAKVSSKKGKPEALDACTHELNWDHVKCLKEVNEGGEQLAVSTVVVGIVTDLIKDAQCLKAASASASRQPPPGRPDHWAR
jgi:hypothetical protein